MTIEWKRKWKFRYSYSTTNQMYQSLKIFILVKRCTYFGRLSIHHQELKTAYTATSVCETARCYLLLSGTRWNCGALPSGLWRIHEFISDKGSMYLSLVTISVTSKVRWRNSLFYYETSTSPPIAAGSSSCLTYACCIRSFELLMMDGNTIRNM